ncbi:MAG: PrgI family protein [bacterium]|nr:PrgI family protein [bacterium]
MRFQVPQFIERESRVIGPLTFKQFGYLGVAGAVAFFFYFTAPLMVFLVVGLVMAALGLSFAFVKIGPRTFPEFLASVVQFGLGTKTYMWRKGKQKGKPGSQQSQYVQSPEGEAPRAKAMMIKESKIHDLALKIETKKRV